MKSIKAADLFCGAGGLGYGLMSAGIDIKYAVDSWAAAVDTYKANLGDHVECAEISHETKLPEVDLIVGGPPCQGFSSAGLRKKDDSRNTLVSCYANLIAKHKPKAFIFENVEGFLTAESGSYVLDLLTPLVEAGYQIRLRKINAANYGVPQLRKRVIAIGGLGFDPGFPEITHQAYGAPGAELLGFGLPKTPSVLEALEGLPKSVKSATDAILQGHFHPALKDDDLMRIKALKPGQTMKDLPEELWHETFKKRAFRRVMDGTPTERRGGAPAGMRRLDGKLPSKTITGGARSEFLHPTEHRYLTLRECARLQTFPDSFVFSGSTADMALQIGNAIPPQLAITIAKHIVSKLRTAPEITNPIGKLLEFTPTVSSGMSPVLKGLLLKVESQFLVESKKTTSELCL